MYDADAGTWSGPSAAMPEARGFFGIVHIPWVDGIGRGHVMVAGGRNGSFYTNYFDSVYFLALDTAANPPQKKVATIVGITLSVITLATVAVVGSRFLKTSSERAVLLTNPAVGEQPNTAYQPDDDAPVPATVRNKSAVPT